MKTFDMWSAIKRPPQLSQLFVSLFPRAPTAFFLAWLAEVGFSPCVANQFLLHTNCGVSSSAGLVSPSPQTVSVALGELCTVP